MQTSADIVISPAGRHQRLPVPQRGRARGMAADVRATARDYVSLAKPRIIVLLLITEVATMFIAARGDSIARSAVLGGSRRRARVGRLGRDQLLVRQGYRPGDGSDLQPAAAVRAHSSVAGAHVRRLADRRVGGGVRARGEHRGGRSCPRRGSVLRLHLHDAAEAPNTAQHRHRRSRGRVSAAGRMGGGPGQHRVAGIRAVCCGVPLDPAAFLVAGAPAPARLRNASVPMLPGIIGTARTHRRILLYLIALIAASLLPGLVLGVGYTDGRGVCSAAAISAGALGSRQRVVTRCGGAVPLFAGLPRPDLRRRRDRGGGAGVGSGLGRGAGSPRATRRVLS